MGFIKFNCMSSNTWTLKYTSMPPLYLNNHYDRVTYVPFPETCLVIMTALMEKQIHNMEININREEEFRGRRE